MRFINPPVLHNKLCLTISAQTLIIKLILLLKIIFHKL